MLLYAQSAKPNVKATKVETIKPTDKKYLGLLRSETLPIKNLLKP